MSISPDVVKSEESLEKQIEVLLNYFNAHHDHNAALKIVKLESLIVERDSAKLEQIDAPSSRGMLSGFSGVSGSNIPYNEAKRCYSEKDISDYAGHNENNCSDESFIEEEGNASSSKKDPKAVYQCKDCSYQTTKVSLFMCHRGTHTGENRFSCSGCSYTTSKKNDLIQHQRKQPGIKPFSCSECSYCTNQKGSLIRHQQKHSGIKPFFCKECSFSTKYKCSLIEHQHIHSVIKAFSCSECSYKTARKFDLIQHQLTHSGIKPFSCSRCSFRASKKGNLIRHQLTHSGIKPFSCKECPYKASRKEHLKGHKHWNSCPKPLRISEFSITGLEGGNSEKCQVMLSRSTNSNLLNDLTDHINYRYIADKKLYSCKDCLYRTAQEKFMKVHQLAHSAKGALSCPKCTFKTLRKSSLEIHEQCHLRYTAKE